jgi:hypothetical protein
MFASSGNNNLPNCIVGATSTLAVPSPTPVTDGTAIPASVFGNGAGLYLLDVFSAGDNDMQAWGYVSFNAADGSLATCTGFFTQVTFQVAAVAGAVATAPYQKIHLINNAGGQPTPYIVNQSGAAITYSLRATKIAN